MTPRITEYTDLQRSLLNCFQQGFPLTPNPYAEIAAQLGVDETEVLQALELLQENKSISRVGPVFHVGSIGTSTLAAMSVPAEQLAQVAHIINEYEAVNHNYEREHEFNLWFVVTAENQLELDKILEDMQQRTGYTILVLPMLEDYHIDLGFELSWT